MKTRDKEAPEQGSFKKHKKNTQVNQQNQKKEEMVQQKLQSTPEFNRNIHQNQRRAGSKSRTQSSHSSDENRQGKTARKTKEDKTINLKCNWSERASRFSE